MFYSNDLLVTKGGQFNVIWLLATSSNKEAVIRKCRTQLTKTNIKKLCGELSKMFPVTGKTNSFSLRTSAILTHGIMTMFKFKIDLVRRDLKKLGTITIQGKKAGGDQPGDGDIDQQPGAGPPTQVDIQLAISVQDVVLDIPELSQTEMEARRRAVTMMEVDNPQLAPLDDWSTPTEPDLPRITLDMFGSEGFLPDVNQELASVLQDQEDGDLSAMMPPPPVRPISASDPHVEVTPTVQEEKKKRSPRQPAQDIANPENLEDNIPPVVDANTPDVEDEIPAQRKRRSSRLSDVSMEEAQPGGGQEDSAIIQHPTAAEDSPASFELPDVTTKPPKKKKRKVSRLQLDEITMLPNDTIRAQLVDYDELLMENLLPPASSLRTVDQLTMGPGRVLKGDLAAFWEEELAATRRFTDDNFDWPEESLLEEQLPEVNPELNPTMEQEIPDDVSEIRAALLPGETVGEVNLSMTDNGQTSTAAKDILQDLEPLPEVQLQDGDFLTVPPVQDLPVFPEVARSPERFPQPDAGPVPPPSPLLADQLDLLTRPDDSVVSSSVLDQIQTMLQSGQPRTLDSLVESAAPTQPTKKDVAKMFQSLLVLEKREEVKMDQEEEEEGFYATITVTRV